MLTTLVALALSAAPLKSTTDTWVLVGAAGRSGVLTATTTGTAVVTDWKVDDNGRGAKIVEHLALDARGFVVLQDISGTSTYGSAVRERYEWANGKATWTSLDEHGEASTERPLYVDVNGSPWSMGQFVRLFNRLKVTSLPVLPSGTLKLERVRDFDLGSKGAPDVVTAYAVSGTSFGTSFVLMRKDAFVGTIGPTSALVEPKYEPRFKQLAALAETLQTEFNANLARKLTHHVEGPLCLTNVHVFDSIAGTVSAQPMNVTVFRGIITGLSTDAPQAGTTVVDGQGGTLLPGLFDSHAHMGATDGPLDLAAGVTFVRDPGNDNDALLSLVNKFDSGEFIGPRVWASGFLEGKSPFSARLGFVISTLDEAKEKLRWYADHGFWGVKIYNSMNPDFVKPIAAEAHRLGLHVSGHVPAFMTSERAVRDGYDEINHVNQLMLGFLVKEGEDTRTPFRFTVIGERMAAFDLAGAPFKNMLALMKERKVTVDPTLATFAPLLLGGPGKVVPSDEAFIDHLPTAEKRARMTSLLDVPPELRATYDASWKKLEQTLLLLHTSGIPLVPGTDDMSGLGLHSELELWVHAGIPASATLTAATWGAAKFLGQEHRLGVIARGHVADLYLVDGDPTKDISAIRKGRLVLKGDSLFFPDELFEAVNVQPFAVHVAVPAVK